MSVVHRKSRLMHPQLWLHGHAAIDGPRHNPAVITVRLDVIPCITLHDSSFVEASYLLTRFDRFRCTAFERSITACASCFPTRRLLGRLRW